MHIGSARDRGLARGYRDGPAVATMVRMSLRALLVLAAVTVAPAAVAQRAPVDPANVHRNRIEVKLREETGAVLREDGTLGSRTDADLGALPDLFAGADRVERVFRQPLDLLDRWHREADERLPPGAVRPGHLGLWFRLCCADAATAGRLLERLRGDPHVEHADHEWIPVEASVSFRMGGDDIPPPTPDLTSHQAYRADAPTGFAFDATRWILGARGGEISLYHIETDWHWDHEDLGLSAANFLGPPTPTTRPGADHGTGVAGVLHAQRNGYGMTGMVDAIDLRLVGALEFDGIANSLAEAAARGAPGDVVTLIGGYNLQMTKRSDIVPFEFLPVNFDATLVATTQGLIVVTSAGNGDNDLDDPRFARRFDLSFRDSGAIMVGATDGALLVRAPFSNYGSRIDANAWGYDVATTGYGGLFQVTGDPRQAYTGRYAGTSSATALMSAVVARISSVYQRQLGRAVTAAEVRALLRRHGTPITGGIGLRPDLAAILGALGLPDGLALDASEVALGGTLTATLGGEPGATYALALSFATANVDLGWNRALHLDPISAVAIGGFALPAGTATWTATIPNDPGLQDLDLYLQGIVLPPFSGAPHVTNSASFWLH